MQTPENEFDRLITVVRERRERKHWAVNRLAVAAGISAQYLGDMEKGRGRRPGLQVIARLARALGTTTDALLIESGLMDPPSDDPAHPPLDVYLSEARGLEPDDIDVVAHLVRRLSESATRYETEDEDEKTRQLRRAGESIEEYRTRTAGNPDAETDADRAAYKGEIPPPPDDHGPA